MTGEERKGMGVEGCLLVLTFVAALVIGGIVAAFYFRSSNELDTQLKQVHDARKALPTLIGELAQNKVVCEAHAAAVKRRRLSPELLAEGEGLYIQAQSVQENCIAMLSAALKTLTPENAAEARRLCAKAVARGEAVAQWAQNHEKQSPTTPELPGLADLLRLSDWKVKEDEKEVAALKEALAKCRFLSWEDVGGKSLGEVDP